jgi:hypothetical protein
MIAMPPQEPLVKPIRRVRPCLFFGIASFLFAAPVLADRPSAAKLLPARTVGYFRIAHAPDLVAKFRETAVGRLAHDEQVRPILSQLYGSATDAFTRVQEQIGLSLEELLKIPQGEMAIALVAPEDDVPSLVLLMDVGDQLPAAQKLLEQAEKSASDNGAEIATEEVDGVELRTIRNPNDRRPPVYFIREGTIVVCNHSAFARQLLAAWDGAEGERLLDNPKFTTIMRRCLSSEEDPPQITWFVDPVELAVAVTRGNFNAQAIVALMPVLGLDGLKGAGGAVTLGAGDFDMVVHSHLLLEPPREGVVEMLALGSGKGTPEPWVPQSAAGYATLYWDAQRTYDAACQVYDRFREEGSLARKIQDRIARQYPELDFENDLLKALGGRLTRVTWMEPPARINSQSLLFGVKLSEPVAFRDTLEKLLAPFQDQLEEKKYAGVAYYRSPPLLQRNRERDDDGEGNSLVRRPTPCIAILGDYLLLTDSEKLLQEAILTKSDPGRGLAKELDFKLIASKISRQPGGDNPGLLSFNRPEEGMRNLYEIARSQETRDWLGQRKEDSRAAKALHDALNDNPLPPFSVVQKYLAPGGAVMVNDETGFHHTAFTLKRE